MQTIPAAEKADAQVVTRWTHVRQLFHRGPWVILAVAWTVFGSLATVRDNFLAEPTRAKWETISLIPHWNEGTWAALGLGVLLVAVIEGSFRIRSEESKRLRQYQAGDPRLEIRKVEADWVNPYGIAVSATVENPGEPTILRSWGLKVTREDGEEIDGTVDSPEDIICRSTEPSSDGTLSGSVNNAQVPVREGGTARAHFRFRFKRPIYALALDERTRFTVLCRTIKGVQARGAAIGSMLPPRDRPPLDDPTTIDKHLGLPADPARTMLDRLLVTRARFDELVEAGSAGDKNAQQSIYHIGRYLTDLSLHHHGDMGSEYVRDYDHFCEGCVRGKIRPQGYRGD